MRPYDYTSRMFRLAFIDRIKASNDIPIHLTECITGDGRNQTDFSTCGSIGYLLKQKVRLPKKLLILKIID